MDLSSRRSTPATAAGHTTTKERGRHAGRHSQGLWRRLGVAALVASALTSTSLAVAPSAGAVPACTTTVNLSALQATITAATAGDVICVNAGTFTPASSTPTIRITKSLTLRGAQAGVTPVDGGRSGGESQLHAYQNNAIMSVEASNVEIDGFEFDDYSYGISVPGGHGGRSNITIKNNWMHADQTSGQYAGMNGHFRSVALNVNTGGSVTTDPLTGVTVTNNLMYANTPWYNTQGALIGHSGGSTTTNFTITNNVMTALPRSGGSNRSIAHGGGPGSYLINNFTMTGNTIAAGTMNFGNVDNGTVTGNTFGDAATTNYAGGYIGLINSTVSGNTLQGGAYFSLWGTQYGFTRPSADVDIENNSFTFASNNFLGLAEPSVDVATIAIRNNKFNAPSAAKNCATAGSETNATIVGAASTGNLVAERNYWGAGSGPGDVFCGFNSIDTTPWMASYTDDATKAGQPGFWPIDVVEGFPVGAPVPTSTGSDVAQSFYNAGTETGSITFGTVGTAGDTTVTPKSSGDPGYITPSGFSLGTTPTYYEVSTTAAFTGDITICLAYKPADFPVGATPQLLHYSGGAWTDVTSSVDTTNLVVCGIVTSLSPFALGTGAITIHAADQTKIYDGTTDVTASPSVDGSTPLPSGSTIGDCTQSFGSKNVGTGKAITISDCKVYNAADVDVTASYDITYTDGTGTITKAGLTINAVADTKMYDGTTASSATPTYTSVFSPDTVSGLTQVFDAAAVGPRTLSVNAYTVNDGNSGANYAVTTNTAAGTITPYPAPTTVTYLGPIVDADGNGSTTFSAQLSSGTPACVSGQTITFSLDGTPIGSGTTNSSGIATYTRTLAIGTYTLLADYAGTGSCAAGFSDNNIVTVADPAGKANGGGSYTVTGVTGRIIFGFNIKTTVNKKTGATTVAGDLTWTVDKTTRLRSKSVTSITNLTCPTGYAKCTTFAGTGELSTWIPDVTKRGGGSWSAPTIATFTAKAYDGGVLTTCVGKKCTNTDKPDAFGMDIVGRTVAGESTPLNITKGNIKVT